MTGVYEPVFEILKPMLVSNPDTELGQLWPKHHDHQLILAYCTQREYHGVA
jgi:hypothetical protein